MILLWEKKKIYTDTYLNDEILFPFSFFFRLGMLVNELVWQKKVKKQFYFIFWGEGVLDVLFFCYIF